VILRAVLVLVAVMMLAGCGGNAPPQVTFTAGPTSVTARPTQFCDLKLQDCHSDAQAPVSLAVPAGTPLRVQVPDEISAAPWQVVFTYRDSGGAQTDGRSPVLAPNQHPDYLLQLPAASDQLVNAQVQQYGPPPQVNPDTGELEFPIRASWLLNVQ